MSCKTISTAVKISTPNFAAKLTIQEPKYFSSCTHCKNSLACKCQIRVLLNSKLISKSGDSNVVRSIWHFWHLFGQIKTLHTGRILLKITKILKLPRLVPRDYFAKRQSQILIWVRHDELFNGRIVCKRNDMLHGRSLTFLLNNKVHIWACITPSRIR